MTQQHIDSGLGLSNAVASLIRELQDMEKKIAKIQAQARKSGERARRRYRQLIGRAIIVSFVVGLAAGLVTARFIY